VPAVLLAASFAPLPANFVQQTPSLDACEQLATWWYQDSGLRAKENADGAAGSLARALGSSAPDDLTADSHTLITAAAAALSDLPPGTVRGSYVTSMDDLIASAKDFLANKETAGLAMLTNALTADQKASQLLGDQAASAARRPGRRREPRLPQPRAVRPHPHR
jgi:hypothetical protein